MSEWKIYQGVPEKREDDWAEFMIDWENKKVYMHPGNGQIKEQGRLWKTIKTYKPHKHGTLPLTQFQFSVKNHILSIIKEYQEALKEFKSKI